MRRWSTFAGRDEHNGGFRNFGDPRYVEAFGHTEVIPVELTEDPDGPYYGWLGFGDEWRKADDTPVMVQGHPGIFEMQFTYGSKAEVDRNRGEVVRMTAEERPESPPLA